MNRILQILLSFLVLISCSKNDINLPDPEFIAAVDISSYPEISNSDPVFYDLDGNQKELLILLKENGVNTVRLRLWENQALFDFDHKALPALGEFNTE